MVHKYDFVCKFLLSSNDLPARRNFNVDGAKSEDDTIKTGLPEGALAACAAQLKERRRKTGYTATPIFAHTPHVLREAFCCTIS
jgi:hypothetical protein